MGKEYNENLKLIGYEVSKQVPGNKFCLVVFAKDNPETVNFVSNAEKDQMIQALEKLIDKLKK